MDVPVAPTRSYLRYGLSGAALVAAAGSWFALGLLERSAPEVDRSSVWILTMEKRVERARWQSKFLVTVMTVLGGLALILAAVGVYGVVSYTARLRTREFGIRSALGAEPAQIAKLVLREAAILAGLGISVGLAFSAFIARGIQGILYDVSAYHPATYLGVALVLALATFAASGVPALRVTRIDPMESLRVE